MWIIAAVGSAFFAGVTSILAKCGIEKTDSDLVTALRTSVVLVFAWLMALVSGSIGSIGSISARSLAFLALSGAATGASWIFYFRALAAGNVNKVVPIDKSSAIMTVVASILIFGETRHIALKLICGAVFTLGLLLMIKKASDTKSDSRAWLPYAILSAVFAALTSILAKIGLSDVDSNLGTALRTCVVAVMAWGVVAAQGKLSALRGTDKKELLFISLSGVATGASWLCYFYAVAHGVLSIVVPIDKLSVPITAAFAYIVFKEHLSKKALVGLVLITLAAIATAFAA